MTHAVVIRFHYPPGYDREKIEWRFAFFRSMVLPRLLAQLNKKFVIAIRTDGSPEWDRRFRELSDRIITFSVNPNFADWIPEGHDPQKFHKKKGRFFVDFAPWESVIDLPKFDIQTSVDSDDLIIRPDFIDKIESIAEANREASAHTRRS